MNAGDPRCAVSKNLGSCIFIFLVIHSKSLYKLLSILSSFIHSLEPFLLLLFSSKMCKGKVSADIDVLLELSALDDLSSFKLALESSNEQQSVALNSFGAWYGRSVGPARQLGLHDRTPLMVAALHGSAAVLGFLLSHPNVNVNLRSASDAATALQLALLAGSSDAVRMLIDSSSAVKTPPPPPPPTPKNKKEYPTDSTMPDVSNGLYSTVEFRMYGFKIKTCSRAYTHDWTECPFVHPGENARRRCPSKYAYSCVPCPEFRRGSSCRNGDGCEYAHGVFESWLHPAQYRTRLCKDEVGCGRKVCFFAHRPEELRSVDLTAASVGVGSIDTPMPMSHPASKLKPSPSYKARSLVMDGYQQKLFDEMSSTASPRPNWPTRTNSFSAATTAPPSGYSNILGSLDPSVRSQLLAAYMNSLQSSSATENSMAKAVMNSRSASFQQRSQSFCDRRAVARHPSAAPSPVSGPGGTGISDWGSRSGKLDWGTNGEELNRFRKSASFAFRGGNRGSVSPPKPAPVSHEEPDLSWVHSLVKDGPVTAAPDRGGFRPTPRRYQSDGVGTGRPEMLSPWGEQMYAEIEQLVA